MNSSRARLPLPSLAAAALVFTFTQAAFAQDAPRPAAPTPATPEAAAPAAKSAVESETARATTAAPDSAAPSTAKPATAAAEKCACESPDEPDAAAPTAEPAPAPFKQLFASASAPKAPSAPELFPRATLRDEQQTGTQQQTQQQTGAAGTTTWTPLTDEQKMKRAARNAFFNPIGIGRVLVSSIITQYNEDPQPHKTTEDEVADGATRFAINFSRRATRTLLGSGVYPILFNQDPRYDRAPEGKGLGYRAAHAVSRVFVQRGDSGKLQPAVSRWAGSLSASALSNAWERSTPGHDRIGTDATFRRFYNSFINDSINNLITEFLPDIKKIFGR